MAVFWLGRRPRLQDKEKEKEQDQDQEKKKEKEKGEGYMRYSQFSFAIAGFWITTSK